MLTEMAAGKPDAIVFELGDGLLGTYGVESILRSPTSSRALTAVVLSANDPVAAWGGVKLLRERFGIEPAVVTGPATDNQVGVEIIRSRWASRRSTPSATRRTRRSRHRGARPRATCANRGRGRMSAPHPHGRARRHRLRRRRAAAADRGHPHFELAAVLSDSQPGEPVAAAFPHLPAPIRSCFSESERDRGAGAPRAPTALFSPRRTARRRTHRPAADRGRGRRHARALRRHLGRLPLRSAAAYEAVYKHPHGAPARIAQFTCAVPEHLPRRRRRTSRTRAASPPRRCWPRAAARARADRAAPLFVAGVTGSTGSGRKPVEARIIRCATATCTPTARSRTGTRRRSRLRESRERRRGADSISCRTRARSRAASTSPCRRP
jgi:hypothetical protein